MGAWATQLAGSKKAHRERKLAALKRPEPTTGEVIKPKKTPKKRKS